MCEFDLTPPVAARHPAMTRGWSGGVGCLAADGAVSPLRILLVDDDAALLGMYRRLVGRWPFPTAVRCAIDAIVALREVGRAMPELVVCDVSAQRRANLGFVRHLARLPAAADTVIVVVSAFEPGALDRLGGLPSRVRVYEATVPFAALRDLATQRLAARSRRPAAPAGEPERIDADVRAA